MNNVQKRSWETFLDPKSDHHSSTSDSDVEDLMMKIRKMKRKMLERKHITGKKRSIMVIRHEKMF